MRTPRARSASRPIVISCIVVLPAEHEVADGARNEMRVALDSTTSMSGAHIFTYFAAVAPP